MMGFAMDVVGKTYTKFVWTTRFSLVGYIALYTSKVTAKKQRPLGVKALQEAERECGKFDYGT